MLSAIIPTKRWCEPHETSNLNLQIPKEGFAYSYLNLSVTRKQLNYCALKRLTKIWRVSFGIYRPPNGDPNEWENNFENIISNRKTINKGLILLGDFNIIVLGFIESKMVQIFREFNDSTWPDSCRK